MLAASVPTTARPPPSTPVQLMLTTQLLDVTALLLLWLLVVVLGGVEDTATLHKRMLPWAWPVASVCGDTQVTLVKASPGLRGGGAAWEAWHQVGSAPPAAAQLASVVVVLLLLLVEG